MVSSSLVESGLNEPHGVRSVSLVCVAEAVSPASVRPSLRTTIHRIHQNNVSISSKETIMTKLTPLRCLCLLCIVVGSLIGSTANAQSGLSRFDKPFDRPAISPYMNLLRNQNSSNSVLNYYGLVRPQQQYMAQNQQLTEQLQTVNRQNQMQGGRVGMRGRQMVRYRMGATGHSAGFLTIGGGVVGQGAEATGQNLMLGGFGASGGGGGTTGNMPGFGGSAGSNSAFGGGGSAGSFGGGFGGNSFGSSSGLGGGYGASLGGGYGGGYGQGF